MINPAVRWLIAAYVALSLLTVALIIAFSLFAPRLVSPEAWVRGVIVAATSLLTLSFANGAAKGRERALLRLRIVVPVILIAIVAVLLFVHLPTWMIVEQSLCGALLLAAGAVLLAGRRQRIAFRHDRQRSPDTQPGSSAVRGAGR